MKKVFVIVFLLFSINIYAQINPRNEFEKFSEVQNALLVKAYEHRDTNLYKSLLKDFIFRYENLNDTARKNYSNVLINAYYNLACLYSILNKKNAALNYLKKSIDAGYIDYAHIVQDSDLNYIRNEKAYKKLILPLRNVGDYLYILRKADKYNITDKRPLPTFTYQAANDTNLVALRKAFNLDSIAGEANEISKILNLLHWVHNTLPHDGQHENGIVERNAINMIKVCKQKNVGLACGDLAIVLNEVCLAMNFKSRVVYCYPKDSLGVNYDTHVINMVFCNTLNKWIWVDPTNDSYIMNENGELLGIEEVRKRIINDQSLIVNPDANWNHKMSKTKENYLMTYMAKNLYILMSPIKSEYDMGTPKPNTSITYIRLLPLEYFKQSPDKTENLNKNNNRKFIVYNTNNPESFYKKP